MKTTLRIALFLASCGLMLAQLPPGAVVPAYSPNGTWESPSGMRYNLRLVGEDLQVKLANPSGSFLEYELTLKHQKAEDAQGDPNRYIGKGFFRAKLKSGKECRFDTQWDIVVFSDKQILGNAPNFLDPDPQTCKPKSTEQVRVELTKK